MKRTRFAMTFGKYRGQFVDELPDDYLAWLGTIRLYDPLKTAVRREQHYRDHHRNQEQEPEPAAELAGVHIPAGDRALFAELVRAGFRTVSKKLHPDHGGSTEAMTRLNALVSVLRRQLERSI